MYIKELYWAKIVLRILKILAVLGALTAIILLASCKEEICYECHTETDKDGIIECSFLCTPENRDFYLQANDNPPIGQHAYCKEY